MKCKIIKLSALAMIMGMTAAHAETTTVDGGTIHFNGQVVETACTVDVNSANQDIGLGQVKASDMTAAGMHSTPVPVQIQLNDCDTSVATGASFGFTGTSANGDDTVLANADFGSAAATNVGVQMKDQHDKVVALDGTIDSDSLLTLVDGTNYANFTAYMQSTGKATAGSVHSSVEFKVQYE